jgi:hypothetical protein
MDTLLFVDIPLTDDRVAFVEAKPAGWAGDVSVKEFHRALADNGIPETVWPGAPSDNKCLERALYSMRSRRALVRPLTKGRGWSLILENADDLDLEKLDNAGDKAHRVEITCKVERGEFDGAVSTLRITPYDHPAVPLIKQEFMRYRGEQDNEGLFKCSQDLSQWFSQTIVPWCRGVATRSRGGSYYIMKGQYLDRMIQVAKSLEQASIVQQTEVTVGGTPINIAKVVQGGRVILKPEVASTAAVEILIDNVISECDRTCDQLSEKLQEGNLGQRALTTQKEVAEDIAAKLKEYESLLGMNLQDVRNRISEITTGIGMAELKLLSKEHASSNA